MSSRLERIVAELRVQPGDTILEIGCGHGVAADLICRQLTGGRLIAIDRSARMIAAASRRNAHHITAGRAEFYVAEMEEFEPALTFDAILAVRVGLFHRAPEKARSIVRRWLKPGGRLLVKYDEP